MIVEIVRIRQVTKSVIAVGTAVALVSAGGAAIIAAPLLVPALSWAARSSRGWARVAFTLLAALVMAEVGWLIAYEAIREAQPYIVLGPAAGFAATIAAFALTLGPRQHAPAQER